DKQKDDEEDEDKRDYRYEGVRHIWKDVFEFPRENETFEVRETATGKLLWDKKFSKTVPTIYTDALANVAAFRWKLVADGARTEAKNLTIVNERESEGKDHDYLIEVVELDTGKPVGAMILDTNNGSFPIKSIMTTRDWVVARDELG